MEIIVLDIETAGFNSYKDPIVEIGMVLVDTKTKKITHIFDKVVKDNRFVESKHKNAWIFKNSTLTVKDVLKANPLEDYRGEIQDSLDKYPMTAFNMSFDIRFMEGHGFKLKKTKCLMASSRKYNKIKNKNGGSKAPSVMDMYGQFFPEEKYEEEHRGCDDALHEGKILLKLVELKEEETKKIKI